MPDRTTVRKSKAQRSADASRPMASCGNATATSVASTRSGRKLNAKSAADAAKKTAGSCHRALVIPTPPTPAANIDENALTGKRKRFQQPSKRARASWLVPDGPLLGIGIDVHVGDFYNCVCFGPVCSVKLAIEQLACGNRYAAADCPRGVEETLLGNSIYQSCGDVHNSAGVLWSRSPWRLESLYIIIV